jgi:hypothetical protein
MRKLSLWARHHASHARILIVIGRCLLFFIACFLANQSIYFGLKWSPLWIYFFIIVFFIAGATYPSKKTFENYRVRKIYDLVVCICGFFITFSMIRQLNSPSFFYATSYAAVPIKPSPYKYAGSKQMLEQFHSGEKTKFSRKEKRLIKKEFKYQLVQYGKAKITGRKANAEQAVLIILACIAAVGLFYLLLGLACALSCNGSETAALIVAIVGTAAIVWGLIAVIRAISQNGGKKRPEK